MRTYVLAFISLLSLSVVEIGSFNSPSVETEELYNWQRYNPYGNRIVPNTNGQNGAFGQNGVLSRNIYEAGNGNNDVWWPYSNGFGQQAAQIPNYNGGRWPPDTGYQTITTYGNRPVYRDSSLNLRGLDLARRYYDKYRSDSRCKYRTDGSSITIIDDSMERTATVSEQSQIETYKRRMRNYNAIHHPAAPRGFTQIYGGGLPFDTETSSAPIPPCFCAYCRVVVVEDY
ncbi:hypothetical protein DdX_02748 [Ditylenchus destructor]|uniref:Uncharacterized protein n=1 Tax=Ditylenchus destructor TaxID=166010 RepID=A0AAD4NHY3_9BILA|nr:hypothetical protein DdX_02748 [Ditylenchus destructor]